MEVKQAVHQKLQGVSFLIYCTLLVSVFFCLQYSLTDDSFIHLRIAKHFAVHGLPYFNLNDPAMATSSPVWTIVLSAILFFFTTANPGGLVAVCANIVAFWQSGKLCQNCGLREWFTLLVPWLVGALLLVSCLQGMESSLAVAIVIVGARLLRRHSWYSVIILLLGCFVRLEVGVFLLLAVMLLFRVRVFPSARVLIIALVLGSMMIGFSLLFYGTVIPQTVKAKSIIYNLSSFEFMLLAFVDYCKLGLVDSAPYLALSSSLCLVAFSVTLLVRLCSRFTLRWKSTVEVEDLSLFFLIGGIGIFTAYAVKGVYLFPWYSCLYLLPIMLALVLTSNDINFFRLKMWLLALAFSPIPISGAFVVLAIWNPTWFPEADGGAKATQYANIGAAISSCDGSLKILAPEIGALGAAYPGVVLDGAGLATTEVFELYFTRRVIPTEHGILNVGLPVQIDHDLVVGVEWHLSELTRAANVIADYEQVEVDMFPDLYRKLVGDTAYLHSRHTLILIRKTLPLDTINCLKQALDII